MHDPPSPFSEICQLELSNAGHLDLTIGELGEQALLALIQKFSPAELTGDDGAVLTLPNSDSLVVSTDMLVDNVHFSDQTTTAFDVGWRGAAANLSDLAAMGATPTGITVALGLPGSTPVRWVMEMYQGLTACLAPWQTPIVGGDLCRSTVKTVSITVFGQVPPGKGIYRHQARVGDWLIATGEHGAARAGLECLLHPEKTKNLQTEQKQTWQTAHQRPLPRLDLLPYLRPIAVPMGGMDSSDGLADAVLQICRASNVGAELWADQLPIARGLTDWVGLKTAIAWTLYGGEDFELVLALPPHIAQPWLTEVHQLNLPSGRCPQAIGKITSGNDILLKFENGRTENIFLEQGFQHF